MKLKLILFFSLMWYNLLFSISIFSQPLEIIIALGFGDCTATSCLFMHEEIDNIALNHQLSIEYISEDIPSFLKDELMYSHFGHTDTDQIQILTDQSTYDLISQGPKTYFGIKNGKGEIIFSGDFTVFMEWVENIFQNEGDNPNLLSESFSIDIDTIFKAEKSLPSLIHNAALAVSDSGAYIFDGYNSQIIYISLTEKLKANYRLLDLSQKHSMGFISRQGIDPNRVKNWKTSVNSASFYKENDEIYALTSLALKLKGGDVQSFLILWIYNISTNEETIVNVQKSPILGNFKVNPFSFGNGVSFSKYEDKFYFKLINTDYLIHSEADQNIDFFLLLEGEIEDEKIKFTDPLPTRLHPERIHSKKFYFSSWTDQVFCNDSTGYIFYLKDNIFSSIFDSSHYQLDVPISLDKQRSMKPVFVTYLCKNDLFILIQRDENEGQDELYILKKLGENFEILDIKKLNFINPVYTRGYNDQILVSSVNEKKDLLVFSMSLE